jgi:hypothetical protein
MPETNNSLPIFGLLPVHLVLELIDSHRGATAVANSVLLDGKRTIAVRLCSGHLLVSKALARADALTIRFLIALSLVEFCLFWSSARDGASVRNELKRLAGFTPGSQAWGTSFASGLAISEPLRIIDTLPIFGRTPESGPFTLFEFSAAMRSPSDVTNWARNGQEVVRPIPPKPPKTVHVSSGDTIIAPAVTPNLFLVEFHRRAQELLSKEDYSVLEELAKGAPTDA